MKYIQKTLTAFLLLAISAVTFSSCNKEDNPSEETLLETYDDLRYFQDCIVNVDSTGAFRYYAYGTPLYEDEPEHLYVGVDNIAQADSIFRTWLAPDVNISESGSKLTCSFTDEEGKAQGAVSFTPGEGADVAVVTASEGTEILYFSKLTFLLNSAWP
ncbi:MAG: hypothetical protein K6G53_09590, partial [Bacteroidales bacterium]|nr:hypothetical protein [Bacteroidales bacterium]